MPRHSTACTPQLRPRITSAQLREAPAPASLTVGDRVYLVGEPACVGTVREVRVGEAVVDFSLGRAQPPIFMLRRVEG
jgi:FKBP-type peptidyl-prolyl cis-trans isomerase 2